MSLLDLLTESPLLSAPSGNPLALLTPRQCLILLGRGAHVPMTDIAKAMGVSREWCYAELATAKRILEPMVPREIDG